MGPNIGNEEESAMKIPTMMYGTAWKEDATTELVLEAVDAGFRAIDTANQPKHYQEPLVGEALLRLYEQGHTREDFFLQTKFTPLDGQDHRVPYDGEASYTEQVEQSFASSLEHLHTEVLDSYLLHGPYARIGLTDADWEVWGAIEALYAAGKAKMIGVSNINRGQLEAFLKDAKVAPMCVQNRCYALRGWDKDVREVCQEHGIVYQGFSLLTANRPVLQHPVVANIARREGVTTAQVVFRFSQQIGMLPLTGTTDRRHMDQDLAVEGAFSLSEDELRMMEEVVL